MLWLGTDACFPAHVAAKQLKATQWTIASFSTCVVTVYKVGLEEKPKINRGIADDDQSHFAQIGIFGILNKNEKKSCFFLGFFWFCKVGYAHVPLKRSPTCAVYSHVTPPLPVFNKNRKERGFQTGTQFNGFCKEQ